MKHLCKYCNKTFSTKSNLTAHTLKAKYCLKLRGNKKGTTFTCTYCAKTFTSKQSLNYHQTSCIKQIEYQPELKYSDKISKDTIISELKAQITDLQNKLTQIAEKAASRPTIQQNNRINKQLNNRINKQLNNFQPITDEHLLSCVNDLTLDHIKNGASGYAQYALDFPLKNRIVCTDFSRRKVKYKNDDGHIVTDPEMIALTKKLFSAIKDRNSILIKEYSQELQQKLWGLPDDVDNELNDNEAEALQGRMNEVSEILTTVMSQDRQVKQLSEGYRSELYHDFIKNVCSGCVNF